MTDVGVSPPSDVWIEPVARYGCVSYSGGMSPERLRTLINHLTSRPERRWVEFKVNNSDPQRIGRYISALANAAALDEEPFGYLLWGVDDSRRVVGTAFDPFGERKGNQSLEFWLTQVVAPMPAVEFHLCDHPSGRVVLMQVAAAATAPVRCEGRAYIRVADATPELATQPDLERQLWAVLQSYRWEEGIARQFASAEEVLQLLDYDAYFRLLGRPVPDNPGEVLATLAADKLIDRDVGDRWNVLHLGAVLFAEELSQFERLSRKAVRVIRYVGDTRVETVRERTGEFGYAKAFEGLITVIDAMLPKREVIGRALRREESPFSELSIRELVANALVHQDLTISGTGPMVEIFDNRVEITNPGKPLIDPSRFIDSPPRSRNEAMAALMRRMNMCEERGSGVDKVIYEAEKNQLPPPDFAQLEGAMRVTLYGPRTFAEMTPSERARACYQHTTLKWLEGTRSTNATLRERLGIVSGNAAQVSRVFKQAMDASLIKLADDAAPRAGYIPWWA